MLETDTPLDIRLLSPSMREISLLGWALRKRISVLRISAG